MAKKMLLVDPKVMEQLKQQPPPPPPPPAPAPPPASSLCPRPMPDVLTDTLVDLDQEMKDVLQQPGVSAHDKASAYQQILHRYLTLGDQYQERSGMPPRPSSPPLMMPPPPPSPPPPPPPSPVSSSSQPWEHWKETAVESVPQRFRKKAKQLMKHMERMKDLSWTPAGEMVYRGRKIPRSNIVDLVGDMMRQRKSVPDPVGWEVFASALKHSNVPTEFIGHKGRQRWMSKARTTPVGDRSFLSSTLSSSPSSLSSPSSQAIGGDEDDSTPRTLVTSVLDSSEMQSPTLISGSWMRY